MTANSGLIFLRRVIHPRAAVCALGHTGSDYITRIWQHQKGQVQDDPYRD